MNPWMEVFRDFNLILLLFSIGGFCATAGSLISYRERKRKERIRLNHKPPCLKGGENHV